MIAFCAGTVFTAKYVKHNARKINGAGEYQPYYGYTIVAKIDSKLEDDAKRIEQLIHSRLGDSYAALPADTYHVSIYTIYGLGNKLIPPVERWLKNGTGRTIPEKGWLPEEVLMQQNRNAMSVLESTIGGPLHIKDATLTKAKTILSLTVQVEEESLVRIQNARKKLAKIYESTNMSMEPIADKLHLTLAYAFGKEIKIDEDTWNQLEKLVQPFKESRLMQPSVYLYESMAKYYPLGSEPTNDVIHHNKDESSKDNQGNEEKTNKNEPNGDVSLHRSKYQVCLFIVLVLSVTFNCFFD